MPDTPAVHHTYHSIEEAEAWAQALGVGVRYDARLDLANLANELLWQLNQRALPLPDTIRVDAEPFRALGRRSAQSPALTNKTRISINPAADYWLDPVAGVVEQRQSIKFWSSDAPLHPLYHEAGHVMLYKAVPEQYDTLRDLTNAQKTVVAGEVSLRACRDIHEFVAEVFAGLIAGRSFSKKVIRWYRARGRVRV